MNGEQRSYLWLGWAFAGVVTFFVTAAHNVVDKIVPTYENYNQLHDVLFYIFMAMLLMWVVTIIASAVVVIDTAFLLIDFWETKRSRKKVPPPVAKPAVRPDPPKSSPPTPPRTPPPPPPPPTPPTPPSPPPAPTPSPTPDGDGPMPAPGGAALPVPEHYIKLPDLSELASAS